MKNILLLILSISYILCCGLTTHNVIANRALFWFQSEEYSKYKSIILKHKTAFQNGAAFPDWGYDCFLNSFVENLPLASEITHWPPFQKATIEYFRKKYPEPWNENAEKLIAFLLGIVSHSVADILWHDLQYVNITRQGFIQAIANVNYNAQGFNYTSIPHSISDTGGEFMCAYEIDLSFLENSWYLPVIDLVQIFQSLGLSQVTKDVLEACNAELYAEVEAIKHLPSELLYPHFASESPFLVDQFQDWWIGGINDMSIWTTWCWPNVIKWIETGKTDSICLVESMWDPQYGNQTNSTNSQISFHKNLKKILSKEINKLLPFINKKNDGNGVIFSYQKSEKIYYPKKLNNNDKSSSCQVVDNVDKLFSFINNVSYSQIGKSVGKGDFNNDGLDDIIIGAPDYSNYEKAKIGAVYIIYGKKNIDNSKEILLNDSNSLVIYGTHTHSKFGYAIESIDINLDGYDDLIISAPGESSKELKYIGTIYIYFGSKNGIKNANKPDFIILASRNYTNLGTSLNHGDIDGDGNLDLLIGAPFATATFNDTFFESGSLFILLSSKKRISGTILTANQLDWHIESKDFFSWFGFHSEVVEIDPFQRLLLVGAPMYNNGKGSIGKIFAFDITHFKHQKKPILKWTITGKEPNAQFGYSFSIGKPKWSFNHTKIILAVTSPTKNIPELFFTKYQGGQVTLLDIENLKGNYFINDIKTYTIFESNEEFSRLGIFVGWTKNNDLWITEPYKDTSQGGGDAGGFYIWKDTINFPSGIVKDCKSSSYSCYMGSTTKSLLGMSAISLDFDGNGEIDILIGSPRETIHHINNSGRVFLLLSVF